MLQASTERESERIGILLDTKNDRYGEAEGLVAQINAMHPFHDKHEQILLWVASVYTL